MGTLGEELRIRMDGRPQNLVAKRVGISQQHLSDILAGRVGVTMGRAAEGLLRLWPDLAPFIVPEDLLVRMTECVKSTPADAEQG